MIEQSSYSAAGSTQKMMSTGVIGWDPVKKRITHHNFWAHNECYTLLWNLTPSGDWEGELRGVEKGKEFTTNPKLLKKGPDRWVYTSKNAAGDEIEVLFTKVPEQKGKKARKNAG